MGSDTSHIQRNEYAIFFEAFICLKTSCISYYVLLYTTCISLLLKIECNRTTKWCRLLMFEP